MKRTDKEVVIMAIDMVVSGEMDFTCLALQFSGASTSLIKRYKEHIADELDDVSDRYAILPKAESMNKHEKKEYRLKLLSSFKATL